MLLPLQLQNQIGQGGGLLSKNYMVSDVLERAREEGEERWDDDFADGISFSKLGTSPSSTAFFFPYSFFL